MLIRLVKMSFKPNKVDEFLGIFERVKQKISRFEGCLHLELWRSKENPSVFFTYSTWKDPEALENYRNSTLFVETWKKIKVCFLGKAETWSFNQAENVHKE
ncbi:MAG: Uncharacterised protein [Bacteroidetes bacterium MED-G17]|nr:MAG: Uncharacterised protein [Bacteroidetes bacterium MED-G17]